MGQSSIRLRATFASVDQPLPMVDRLARLADGLQSLGQEPTNSRLLRLVRGTEAKTVDRRLVLTSRPFPLGEFETGVDDGLLGRPSGFEIRSGLVVSTQPSQRLAANRQGFRMIGELPNQLRHLPPSRSVLATFEEQPGVSEPVGAPIRIEEEAALVGVAGGGVPIIPVIDGGERRPTGRIVRLRQQSGLELTLQRQPTLPGLWFDLRLADRTVLHLVRLRDRHTAEAGHGKGDRQQERVPKPTIREKSADGR